MVYFLIQFFVERILFHFFFFLEARSIPPVNNMELKGYFIGVSFDLKIHQVILFSC